MGGKGEWIKQKIISWTQTAVWWLLEEKGVERSMRGQCGDK